MLASEVIDILKEIVERDGDFDVKYLDAMNRHVTVQDVDVDSIGTEKFVSLS